MLRGALPFVVSDICAQLYTQSTTIIVGSHMAHSAVGIYRGAWSFVGYSFVVPAVLFQTTLPHLNAEVRPSARRVILLRSGALFLSYAVVTGVFMMYGAPGLLPVLYGSAFTASADLLQAFALIPLCKAMSFYAVLILLMQRQITRRIAVQLLVVTVVWATAPWLVRTDGIIGAVTAQLLSEAVLGCGYMMVAAYSLRLGEPIQSPATQVVVTNLHGLANLGDAAIHQAQVALLAQCMPNARLTLFSVMTAEPQRRFPHTTVLRGVHSWVYDESGRIASLRTRVRKTILFVWVLLIGRWGPVPGWGMTVSEHVTIRALQHADVVYMSGGGYLYDGPSATPWRRFVLWDWWILADALLAIAWQRPVVLLPQSIGPCHNRPFAWLLRWTMSRVQSITVRDGPSAALLRGWGITHQIAPDLAWGLPNPAASGINNPPILGVSVIDWGGQYPSFRGQRAYEDAVVETIKHFRDCGWRVQLYSQCRDGNHAWDDRVVSYRIAQQIGDGIELMPDYATPEALSTAYAALDCLVATRLHAAILRMRSGGACVVIGYLPKAAGLMSAMGLSDWHIPIADVNAERLMSAIETRTQQQPLLRSALERIDEQRLAWRAEFAQQYY
jgi:colanic acid/amylovoran biosynthesis protein